MTLTPLVYWAQRHKEIYLRVELIDVKNVNIHVHDNTLHFKAKGHGAKGQNDYEFSLDFFSPVKSQVSYRSTQRQVNITVDKRQPDWWDRLVVQERKPVFLTPDFERWLDESDAEMEIREKEEKKNRLKSSRHKEDGFVSLKMGLLFFYNLVQFLGFSWVFANMTVRLYIFGQDSLYDTFHTMSDVVFFCQVLASVEVLNAGFGVVRSGVIPTFLQVICRNFILFIVFGGVEEMHYQPVVFFVFYLWSTVDIFRYPYNMLDCVNTEWKTLSWIHYTIWIPLFPLTLVAEAAAVIQSIPIFIETGLFSIPLPKAIGTTINFSNILYVYLVILFIGFFINFRHMYKQRKRHFRTKKRKAL